MPASKCAKPITNESSIRQKEGSAHGKPANFLPQANPANSPMRVNDTRKMIIHLFSAGFFTMIATVGARAAQNAPSSRLDIYGFVMADFGYDFRTNNPDWFDVN